MYRTVIELKKDVEENTLRQLKCIIENAFSNREGTVVNISNKPFCFEFAGEEKEHGCLEIGLLNLKREKIFRKRKIETQKRKLRTLTHRK